LPRVRGRAGVGAAGRRSRGQAAPRRSVPPSQPSPAGGGRSRPAALDAALLPPPQAGEGAAVVALDSGLRSRLRTVGPARRSPMSSMRIGQLARTAGVAIDTVRYYERVGLLAPAGRLASGYRRYGDAELKRLRFIRRAKALGFSLEDIAELLSLGERSDVASSRAVAARKQAQVAARIAELERVRDGLHTLVAACPGHGRAEACPILNALSGEDAT